MRDIPWTPEQVRAIRSEADTLLVASAGTGKTTTVVGKVLWLLGLPFGVEEETGAPLSPPPEPCRLREVAAITFTEKAASDLKRKLREAAEASPDAETLRWDLDRASIGTIHSFCGELLREHALRLGIDPTFRVLDENEAWAAQDELIRDLVLERLEEGDPAVRDLLVDTKLTGWTHQPGAVDHVREVLRDLRWHGDRYERWVAGGADGGAGSSPDGGADGRGLDAAAVRRLAADWDARDDAIVGMCDTLVRLAREALDRWKAHLEEENLRDFDSLILDARDLLVGPEGGAALESIRRRYRILVIDEFQDTDFAQRDIAFAIARGVPRPQLYLVGDPKQSIYRFRGADVSVWNAVQSEFEADGHVLRLSRNFRSRPAVVDFVNVVAERAMEETGQRLAEELPAARVQYAGLVVGREEDAAEGVEWLVGEGGDAAEARDAQARQVATRILELVDDLRVADPESGERRDLAFRDIAVLYRARTGLEHFEAGLTRYGIPYYLAGAPHLKDRQEIADVLNALHLLRAPGDDLRLFGYLRSPFVGLRDETIGRMRLLGPGGRRAPLLRQARRFLRESRPWPAPEHPELAELEMEALERALRVLERLRNLAARLPVDRLIEELLERTGYRLHVLMLDRGEEVLANLQSLIHFAEGYRDLDVGAFLEVWDRWTRKDVGIPQAPLYSKDDDVVTLSTIHAAKGLEWPVVFLVGIEKRLWRQPSNEFWSDRELGPLVCLRTDDRGPRANHIVRREELEAEAEEARLLYVAATRARERLMVVGPRGGTRCYGAWLESGLPGCDVDVREEPGSVEPLAVAAPPTLAWLDGLDARLQELGRVDAQLDLLDARADGPEARPALVAPLPEVPFRWLHSATELEKRANDPEAWERRYRHGVQAPWEFAPEPGTGPAVPRTVRGSIIHGVLERIQEADELSRILDETIGSLDEPQLEQALATGTEYRRALEEEIRRVVESEEWRWYVERPHRRELEFLDLSGRRDWRWGFFDLYRLRDRDDAERALIVDFKTHPVTAEQAEGVARGYEIQAGVYRAAGEIAGPVRVVLHFTGPNVVVEMAPGRPAPPSGP